MKPFLVGATFAAMAALAVPAGAMQPDGWVGAFSLAPSSPSLGGPVAGNPGDIWAPGPPPQRIVTRAELGVPGFVPGNSQGGVVDAISAGRDFCGDGVVLLFYSVTAGSAGEKYPIVPEVASNGAAGDVFTLSTRGGCFSLRGPTLERDATDIVLVPGLVQDELSSLDVPLAYEPWRRPLYFSVDAATATRMTVTSGVPVDPGDILRSNRRGDWRVWISHSQLGLPAGTELDAFAYDAGSNKVWFSVSTSTAPAGMDGATLYVVTPPLPPGTTPPVFVDSDVLGCLPTDDVDAVTILDPNQFFGIANYCFLGLHFDAGLPDGCVETTPGGIPASTLWHPEQMCSSPYSVSLPIASSFSTIVGSPGTVTLFGSGVDDGMSSQQSLGFSFPFFGNPMSSFQASANGFLAFNQILGAGFFENVAVPDPAAPNDLVAAWWDDLHTGTLGSVSYLLIPNGVRVEWNMVERFPSNGSGEAATFQVELSSSPVPGTIRLHYDNPTFAAGFSPASDAWDATIGIEDAAGSVGISPAGLGGTENPIFPSSAFLGFSAPSPRTITFTPSTNPAFPLPASFGDWAMAYNRGDLGLYNYDTGSTNAGALRSPAVGVPAGTKNLFLTFDYLLQTQSGGSSGVDLPWVEANPAPAVSGSWAALPGTPIPGNSPCPTAGVFTQPASPGSPLAALIEEGGSVRFRFDTVNASANNYAGWAVDNVLLKGGPICFFQRYGQGCGPGCGPVPAAGCNQACASFPRIGSVGPPCSPSSALTLAFEYAKETEGGGVGTFDQCFVEARPTGGAWLLLTQIVGNSPCPDSTNVTLAVPGIAGGTWRHRFRFDTIDSALNDFQGWTVDNVVATDASGPTVVFAENFEGGGLGPYAETDAGGAALATLWHGEGLCGAGGSGSYSIVPTSPPPSFPSIVGNPSAVVIHGPLVDDAVSSFFRPPGFSFFGAPVSTVNVDSNGPVSLSAFSDFTNDPIPTAAAPNGWVSAWWDDNHTGPSGSVMAAFVGGSAVFEWNVEHFPGNNFSGEFARFQVRIDPAPADTIALLYDEPAFVGGSDPWSATIGFEDPTGLAGGDATGFGAGNAICPSTSFLLTPSGGTSGTPIPSSMGTSAASYNQGDVGIYNYETPGLANAGAIESSDISTVSLTASTFAITVSGVPLSSMAFLALAILPPLVPTPVPFPPPIPLSSLGLPAPCCQLEIGFPFILFPPVPPNASGVAQVPLPIPPGLEGDVLAQWACVGPGATISMSDAAILGVR